MLKYIHFYFNKYILSLFISKRYFIAYDFNKKVIWYRVAKVGTRSILKLFEKENGSDFLYPSAIAYNSKFYKKYYKFAFVRNPYDRFVSSWKDKVVERNYFNFPNIELEKMKDLNHFIGWVENQNIEKCDEHIRSQHSLIDVEQLDFLGRFESFNEDFKKVAQELNVELKQVPHLNSTKKKEVTLTSEQKYRIKKIYEKDFSTFYSDIE
jgi:hypothetical protein